MTHVLEGGCHCGAIRYRYHSPIGIEAMPVRACGCSFCKRIRGRYTSHPEGRLEATLVAEDAVSRYQFGTISADLMVCKRCGGMPFVVSTIEDRMYAVLNINTLDGDPLGGVEAADADFDGESKDDRLARRKNGWIGDVRLETGAE